MSGVTVQPLRGGNGRVHSQSSATLVSAASTKGGSVAMFRALPRPQCGRGDAR